MWATLIPGPTPPITPFLSIPTTNLPPPPERNLAAPKPAHPRRRIQKVSATSKDVSGLGKAVLGAVSSGAATTNNPGSNPHQGKKMVNRQEERERPEKEEKGKEISGSDILRALQRASARKAQISLRKKQQQKRAADSLDRRESAKRAVDHDKVRPLTIKSDWATRLDELEKRLQQFLSI